MSKWPSLTEMRIMLRALLLVLLFTLAMTLAIKDVRAESSAGLIEVIRVFGVIAILDAGASALKPGPPS